MAEEAAKEQIPSLAEKRRQRILRSSADRMRIITGQEESPKRELVQAPLSFSSSPNSPNSFDSFINPPPHTPHATSTANSSVATENMDKEESVKQSEKKKSVGKVETELRKRGWDTDMPENANMDGILESLSPLLSSTSSAFQGLSQPPCFDPSFGWLLTLGVILFRFYFSDADPLFGLLALLFGHFILLSVRCFFLRTSSVFPSPPSSPSSPASSPASSPFDRIMNIVNKISHSLAIFKFISAYLHHAISSLALWLVLSLLIPSFFSIIITPTIT